jgi:hypothetical protein
LTLLTDRAGPCMPAVSGVCAACQRRLATFEHD